MSKPSGKAEESWNHSPAGSLPSKDVTRVRVPLSQEEAVSQERHLWKVCRSALHE